MNTQQLSNKPRICVEMNEGNRRKQMYTKNVKTPRPGKADLRKQKHDVKFALILMPLLSLVDM